jgi:hypothetical protein
MTACDVRNVGRAEDLVGAYHFHSQLWAGLTRHYSPLPGAYCILDMGVPVAQNLSALWRVFGIFFFHIHVRGAFLVLPLILVAIQEGGIASTLSPHGSRFSPRSASYLQMTRYTYR